MKTGLRVAFAVVTVVTALATPAGAADIDACKYVAVTELARDPYGVAEEVRREAAARGFILIMDAKAVPPEDMFKACVITADWLGAANAATGELVLQVMDAVTGTPVAVTRQRGINWWSIDKTVKNRLTQVFEKLGYTGFKEEAYRARMERLYPPRPKMLVTEAEVAGRTQGIEGVWTDRDEQYRLAIVALAQPVGADGGVRPRSGSGSDPTDYAAVVLQTVAPLWQVGEIKAEISGTSDPDRFATTYYLLNKQPVTVEFVYSGGDQLTGTVTVGTTAIDVTLLRAK
jgi:hypothetical protein